MLEIFMNPEYATMWSAVGGIATGIASLLGAAALLYSMVAYKESLQLSHYSELDSTYSNLLQIALEKPYLYNTQSEKTPEQKQEYDIYAFIVWNFLETIHDRCQNSESLMETWSPILKAESERHINWFRDPQNKSKFKDSFHQAINELVAPQPQQDVQPLQRTG